MNDSIGVSNEAKSGGQPSSPGVGAQLWLRTKSWLVRADHVVAVGVERAQSFSNERGRFQVQISTLATMSVDSELVPVCYELFRFADEPDAQRCAAKVVERIGTWHHGYGVLHISPTGGVVTTRPSTTQHDGDVLPTADIAAETSAPDARD